MEIPESARAVIDAGAIAHCVTLNADGGPQLSAVWIGVEDGEVVFASLGMRQKLRNLARDPRIAFSFEAGNRNAMGLDEYVVLHGTARITEGGAPELLQRLAHVYLGPEVVFPPMPDPPPGYVVRTRVERVGGVGAWAQ
jgi:PPOX class probable F420-dependent enzyme